MRFPGHIPPTICPRSNLLPLCVSPGLGGAWLHCVLASSAHVLEPAVPRSSLCCCSPSRAVSVDSAINSRVFLRGRCLPSAGITVHSFTVHRNSVRLLARWRDVPMFVRVLVIEFLRSIGFGTVPHNVIEVYSRCYCVSRLPALLPCSSFLSTPPCATCDDERTVPPDTSGTFRSEFSRR